MRLNLGIGLLCLLLVGCSTETLESASKDAQKNGEIVAREVKRAEEKARPTLNRFQKGLRVTTALKASSVLPKSLRADVNDDRLRLVGTVKTEEQKKTAERIARDILGPDETVVNDIKVVKE